MFYIEPRDLIQLRGLPHETSLAVDISKAYLSIIHE